MYNFDFPVADSERGSTSFASEPTSPAIGVDSPPPLPAKNRNSDTDRFSMASPQPVSV